MAEDKKMKNNKKVINKNDTDLESINEEENIEEEYVFERYNPKPDQGLDSEVARLRLIHGYANIVEDYKGKTIGKIFRDNIFTFFNMLYLTITVLLVIARSWGNLLFIPIILANTIIGITQEIKAKKMVDKLSLVSAPKANLIRDGEQIEVTTDEVVIDDIVVLVAGNQIYTDSIVVKGTVEVNESLITGEADAIIKHPGDLLYSGSYIVSGSCRARVENVGVDNYVEKLASEARKHQPPRSELLRTLKRIIKGIAFIIIPLSTLTFIQEWRNFELATDTVFLERYSAAIVKTAGVVIGMIPAGLFLLTSTALAVGVRRLGKNKTLVQELYCIEMLARVDVLCLDKTGTITDGTMRVIDCVEVKNPTDFTIREIVGSMMNTFSDSNPTSEALVRFFDKNKVLNAVASLAFSSKRKYSAVTFENSSNRENVGSFYLGAPEFVLTDQYDKVRSKVERFASQGCRVLVLGHTNVEIKENQQTPKNIKPVALIVIQDHIREEAFATIEYFRKNGVEVKVISGDNPMTVSEIAERAGIVNANRFISLEGLTDEEVSEIAFDYTVFGRVSPSQKRVLVQAFKAQKKTVAMTGDGVNDILALKEADCSIAMASGSEAVRYVSHLVLQDSNFASMPKVVSEGRRVINNVQKTSTLFLTKTLFTILLTIMYLILRNATYPFEPSQFMLIETFSIGIPATVLALQPNTEIVKGRFILNVLKTTLPGAITVVLFHLIMYGLSQTYFTWDPKTYSTITLILTTTISILVLFRVSRPFNWLKKSIFVFVVSVCVVAVLFFGDAQFFGTPFLDIVSLGRENTILLLLLMQAAYPTMMIIDKILVKFKLA